MKQRGDISASNNNNASEFFDKGTKDESSEIDAYGKNTLNYRVQKYSKQFFAAFFFLGIFNNYSYVLVQAGSSSIAGTFDKKDFMGAF